MESNFRWCTEWYPDKPDNDGIYESPIFSFQNIEWCFQLKNHLYYYSVFMQNKNNLNAELRWPFRVTTFGANKYTGYFQSCTYCHIEEPVVLWSGAHRDFSKDSFVFFIMIDYKAFFTDTEHKSDPVDMLLMHVSLEHLSLDLKELCDSCVHPDVQLKCDGGILDAHWSVLAARSKVFSDMFQVNMKERQCGVINLPDLEIERMRLILKFIYSGKIPNMSLEMTPWLYTFADKFQLCSLKTLCSQLMIKFVSRENYILFLELADKHNDDLLQERLTDYIIHRVVLMKNDLWLKFSSEHPRMAVKVFQKYLDKLVKN